MKQIKYAIAFVIYNQDRSKFLIVQRPSDDENFPDIWGLPAGSVKDDETFEECVIRSGREKLGVELKPTKFIGRSNIERENHILHMKEYKAKIINGEPKVPQEIEGMTQYQQWKWGVSSDLKDAKSKGSLCSQIYLTSINNKWGLPPNASGVLHFHRYVPHPHITKFKRKITRPQFFLNHSTSFRNSP